MPPLRNTRFKAEPVKKEVVIVESDESEPEDEPVMRRGTRERKPRKYTNLNESDLGVGNGAKTPKSTKGQKRKHSDSDPDFDLNDGSSGDEDDDFVDYDVSDEEQQTLLFEDWRKKNLGDREVFKTIRPITQGKYSRHLVPAPTVRRNIQSSYWTVTSLLTG